MSKLDHQIRAKRYKVKEKHAVHLIVEFASGIHLRVKIKDCSSTGVRGTIVDSVEGDKLVQSGDIATAAKIVADGFEYGLGRIVFRRFLEDESSKVADAAFSTVDLKIPVNGALSKYLDLDFSTLDNGRAEEFSSDRFSLAHFLESEYLNVDLFDRLRKFDIFRSEWEQSKKYGYKNVRESSMGARVNLTRVRKNNRKDYVIMGSNDYLGLGAHPSVMAAAKNAVDKYGFGSTGSPVTTGTADVHIALCDRLARIHKKDAGLLFNSGYAANVGIISSITTSNDLVIADALCHASIQDGMQMSKATGRFFKHNDTKHLEMILERERNSFNGCLVITEGVFSMDGDTAKLDEIFSIARKYNARIMVDQAHCFGVVGQNGMGICEKFNLLKEVDIIMGTFSKICGGIGGFVVGSTELIEWIRSFSRAHIFSVSLAPSTIAAVDKALDLFLDDKSHLENLRSNVKHFLKNLESIGYPVNQNHESAVVPVVVGDEKKLGEMYQSLLEDGVVCIPIVYPAVSRKNCRFRFTVMATHTKSDLDYVTACLEKAMIKADFSFGVGPTEIKAS